MLDLIWNLYQQRRIDETRDAADKAQRSLEAAQFSHEDLQRRVEHLALVCEALWELLSERTGVTREDLKKKIVEIDLRDNRVTNPVRQCGVCHRPVAPNYQKCFYCGAPLSPADVF